MCKGWGYVMKTIMEENTVHFNYGQWLFIGNYIINGVGVITADCMYCDGEHCETTDNDDTTICTMEWGLGCWVSVLKYYILITGPPHSAALHINNILVFITL